MKKIDYSKYEGHTPGPWVLINVGEKENIWVVGELIGEDDKPIRPEDAQERFDEDFDGKLVSFPVCEVEESNDYDSRANGELLRAAPDLLAACRERDEEIERLRERDGNAKVELCYDDGIDPFARIDLRCADYGVADNVYVVELPKGFNITRAALADVEGYT